MPLLRPPVAAAALPSTPVPDVSTMIDNADRLFWQIAEGALEAASAIAERHASIRTQGSEPHIVARKEALNEKVKVLRLANTGVLVVQVSIPGASGPLAVVETHMNSRGAFGVRRAEADPPIVRRG